MVSYICDLNQGICMFFSLANFVLNNLRISEIFPVNLQLYSQRTSMFLSECHSLSQNHRLEKIHLKSIRKGSESETRPVFQEIADRYAVMNTLTCS